MGIDTDASLIHSNVEKLVEIQKETLELLRRMAMDLEEIRQAVVSIYNRG